MGKSLCLNNAAQGKLHASLLSAAVPGRLTARSWHCKYTYEPLLMTQGCAQTLSTHRSAVQSLLHDPLLSIAVPYRLASSLCH